MRQHVLVQCTKCKKWYIVPIPTGPKGGVSFEMIYAVEEMLKAECSVSHHKGRRRRYTK